MPVKPRVVVVGLGPAGADLLLPAARAALVRVPIRFVRTARHPAVDDLARDGIELEPLDLLYDQADDLDTVYAAIADRVVETAREQGEIVYAVPGSPTIAERSVELVRAAGIDVELIPGISFVDLAWWRLGIDPMHGARVVDARAFAIDAAGSSGPMLIAQCRLAARVLRGEARAARHARSPTTKSRCCNGSACPTSASSRSRSPTSTATWSPTISRRCSSTPATLRWARSSRACWPSPSACAARAVARGTRRRRTTASAGTCSKRPTKSWRRSSSSPPTRRRGDVPIGAYDALEDELGDLLFQVMIQSVLASEAGAFTVADVARAVHAKLVRRHPHVFGDVQVNDAERGRHQLGADQEDREGRPVARGRRDRRASRVDRGAEAVPEGGVDRARARRRPRGRRARSVRCRARPTLEATLGSALAAVAAFGREHDIDAESALASWARRYKDQFRRMEQLAAGEGVDLAAAPASDVRAMWNRAGSVGT